MKASIITDQDYLPQLLTMLKAAKKDINILSYSFAIGSAAGRLSSSGAPMQIAQLLASLKTKNKKLRIRIYVEGHRDTSERNAVTVSFLRKAGIEVKTGATHAKGFSVDGRYLLFGSTNLTNQSITKNREANIYADDKALTSGFNDYFDHLWEGGKHGEIHLSKPFHADGDFRDALVNLIDRAKKRIDFSIYFFNQKDIERALVRAYERGVAVQGFVHLHATFALSYIYANRRTVKRLQEAGLENIHVSRYGAFYHSKYLVVDGKELMLGTGNWLEEDVHIHPQLYVQLKGVKLSRQLIRHLEEQLKEDAWNGQRSA